jgi:preprotein translocase subunit SecA
MLMLQTIDQRWKEHLERIDHLKEGIHLRAHAQKDPLIEYKKEAFVAFQEMNSWIFEETVEKLLKFKLVNQERAREVLKDRQELDESELNYVGANENAAFVQPPQPRMAAPLPTPGQPLEYSYGPANGGDDGRGQPNREQRRRMEKKAKKKKIKI